MSDLPKKSNTGKILIVLCCIALAIGAWIWYNNKHKSGFQNDSYEKNKMTLADMEKANPKKFLSAGGDFNKNLFGTKFKVHGKITNTATIANYKDVALNVRFFSETKTIIEQREIVVYDFFPANSTKDFELKIDRPEGCKNVTWSVSSATAY